MGRQSARAGHISSGPLKPFLQYLFGRPLARGGSAVEVAEPFDGRLSASPGNPAERLAERTAEGSPAAGGQISIVGTTGELVLGPECLDIVRGIPGIFPEEVDELTNERFLAAGRWEPDPTREACRPGRS